MPEPFWAPTLPNAKGARTKHLLTVQMMSKPCPRFYSFKQQTNTFQSLPGQGQHRWQTGDLQSTEVTFPLPGHCKLQGVVEEESTF